MLLPANVNSSTTTDHMSEAFQTSMGCAQMSLEATAQHHAKSATMSLSHQHRMGNVGEVPRLRCIVSVDIEDPRCRGSHGHEYFQF